ncbi:hypothetical protein CELL_01694 [Cellulomonas sp. T2.31MG-18]
MGLVVPTMNRLVQLPERVLADSGDRRAGPGSSSRIPEKGPICRPADYAMQDTSWLKYRE